MIELMPSASADEVRAVEAPAPVIDCAGGRVGEGNVWSEAVPPQISADLNVELLLNCVRHPCDGREAKRFHSLSIKVTPFGRNPSNDVFWFERHLEARVINRWVSKLVAQ